MDSDSGMLYVVCCMLCVVCCMLYVVCCMCSGQPVWAGDWLVWLVLAVRDFMYRLDL